MEEVLRQVLKPEFDRFTSDPTHIIIIIIIIIFFFLFAIFV
jgi:hypothetical protein